MARSRFPKRAVAALAAVLIASWALPSAGQEDTSVNAFAVWTSQGAVAQSAEKQLVMASALTGTLFVESTEGPVDAGQVVCPAMVHIDTETGRQSGKGYCTFTAHDGVQAFGEWECSGIHLVGCRGKFHLTGGTGRLANVKGTGNLILRGRFHDIDIQRNKAASYTVTGIALWRDLRIEP